MSGKYQENITIKKINAASCRRRVRPRRSLTSLHAFRVEPIYCAAFAAARNECRVRPLRSIAPQFLFCKLFFSKRRSQAASNLKGKERHSILALVLTF